MPNEDDDAQVRSGYAAREQERQWLAGQDREDEWVEEGTVRQIDEDERESRERMKRRIEEEYNRNRFRIEDDDRVGRVWGGDDDFESEPTGVIRTTGRLPPSDAELQYIPGRARMGRDGDEGPGI